MPESPFPPLERRDRAGIEDWLDRLVSENRFTIAVVFPAVGAISLYASAMGWYPDPVSFMSFNPWFILLGVIVMRLPLVAGLAPLVDRRAAFALAAVTAYAFGIEMLGVSTGWPYGAFEYGIDLGPMLLGLVPIGLPVFFFPLVLNSYLLDLLLLGEKARSTSVRLLAVIATVLLMDLVLDPAAVGLGFWMYEGGGAYYGVPWSNYAGWVLSATVSVVLFDVAFDTEALFARLRSCPFMLDDLVSFVILWGTINVAFGNWIPAGFAGLFGVSLLVTDRFDFDVRDTIPGAGWVAPPKSD
ncbi:bisanhydrobacterioruberin hydratase [Halapricum hydrolyticum]|uniref:Carotenoid biosynthesis protein n=1 Tax=Halapricum hydrolyticum TaxID=2979991 RepID=A0AAE3IAJ2_9EURY|nr:bisanhydrobacterioruberin hydratase [Halapricum hydrolyticum]MCU4717821.1 carotenoid biosynthesis protein [Halapricum hydrolyticum]MCU4726985.1 carotenoid biosynthesis protein [Halapricum hydrolyticum]